MKRIDQDQENNSKSFLERLNENNEKTYFNNLHNAVKKNEERSYRLKSLVNDRTFEEAPKRDQIESLHKLHHYRELKRNKETKDTSMFNKMSVRSRKPGDLITDHTVDQTGLQW